MSSRWLILASLVSSFAVGACATGTLASGASGDDGDDGDTPTADAGKHFDGGYGQGEGGSSLADSGIGIPGKDGGAKSDGGAAPIDSGTTPPVDSGTTPPPALCSGEFSSRTDPEYGVKNYDAWCDDLVYYNGYEFPCTTNTDCDGIFTVPACCYKGDSTTYCYDDTGGKAQCVPQ